MDMEKLARLIRKLPMKDKLKLLANLGLWPVIKKSYAAKVEIYDLGKDEAKPRAVITYPNGETESIDIIESVRRNAASIGHPAILFALHRWEQMIRHLTFLPKDIQAYLREYDTAGLSLSPKQVGDKAESHLMRIGEALVEGAKKRALRKELLLGVLENVYGQKSVTNEYLEKTWELLGSKEIREVDNESLKLERLRNLLYDWKYSEIAKEYRDELFPKEFLKNDVIEVILDFLSSSGSRFLAKRRKPKQSSAFHNAFYSSRYDVNVDTLKSYRSRTKQSPIGESDAEYLVPRHPGTFGLDSIDRDLDDYSLYDLTDNPDDLHIYLHSLTYWFLLPIVPSQEE
jgi:hypothetical protein